MVPNNEQRGGMRYFILDTPPWWEACILGFQQYLTMLGSTVLIPFICVPPMGGSDQDLANVICTIFFASGIITLLQTVVGDRLPIIQGGSFAYISPVLAITAHIKATRSFASEQERFLETMREVQGGIVGSGLIIAAVGLTGAIQPVLQAISPITVAANIAVLGLALYPVGVPGVAACPQLGAMLMGMVILFSQYLRGVSVRLPGRMGRLRAFELFPVLLAILLSWLVAWVLTASGVYDRAAPEVQAACRTDQSHVLADSPWFRFPYPGQWGPIKLTWASTLTMLAGALPAMIESLGDYFAAADISGAPPPPPGVLSRAIALQGLTCAMAGAWGTSSGTTAYNENIGALQITRVASRRVVQLGATCAAVFGLVGKFGGLFASLPSAMVSGLFCVMFGLICGVGLSQMRHASMSSNRNIFILGFSLYMGLSVAYFTSDFTAKHGRGPVSTPSDVANGILNSLLQTAAAVALVTTLFLDNTIPGTAEERGLAAWSAAVAGGGGGGKADWWEDDHLNQVYGLPFNLTRTYQRRVGKPARAWAAKHVSAPLAACVQPAQRLGRRIAGGLGATRAAKQQQAPEDAPGPPAAASRGASLSAARQAAPACAAGFPEQGGGGAGAPQAPGAQGAASAEERL